MRSTLVLVAILAAAPGVTTQGAQSPVALGSLTIEDRVAAQRAIEEVYWRHRIWPRENARPKPPLDAVLPASAIRARVEDYLLKCDALDKVWGHPLTAAELQAELDRMSARTRAGDVLQEIFDALGNDPALIAETLARPALADRLVRGWYARDARFHGAVRERAEAETDPSLGPLRENDDSFYAPASAGSMLRWPKVGFEAWWAERRKGLSTSIAPVRGELSLPTRVATSCVEDTWSPMRPGAADPREFHTAVWTGTEMIVWGGYGRSYMNTGGRYNPATDTWSETQQGPLTPSARQEQTAVWTGTEMIVWGGRDASGQLDSGGRYDPATDTWRPTTLVNAPLARQGHSMLWSGTKVIVWGGNGCYPGCVAINSGGLYDPSTDTWTATAISASTPSTRYSHTGVWTGSEMIVWGGHNGSPSVPLQSGARYDPVTNTWTPTSTGVNVPAGRYEHVAVWDGHEMIVWGGLGAGGYPVTGGRYDPVTNTWTPTSTGAGVPAGRRYETAVWDGRAMIVWGGFIPAISRTNTGARYDPLADTWTPTSAGATAPSVRMHHTAVWTGNEMIVWGGDDPLGEAATGGRYFPDSDTWLATGMGDAPAARYAHAAVWTGAEMIVWGGGDNYHVYDSGGLYDPATDTWSPTPRTDAPAPRWNATGVWTGTQMIVWGGSDESSCLDSGGRYSPLTGIWLPVAARGTQPAARRQHTAVWTGREMIVWGGTDGVFTPGNLLRSGGRYDPNADAWIPTNVATAPTARAYHTAVLMNGRMIVWGGSASTGYLSSGARYDPSTDTWLPTSVASGVPAARYAHSAAVVGGEMIVWGGATGSHATDSGGRYDPIANVWLPTSTATNDPGARLRHSAMSTGTEMIVWGGNDYVGLGNYLNSGARYRPATDSWLPTGMGTNVPSARESQTALWTGKEMIVWGGWPPTGTGARYCACPSGRLVYLDKDGDGFGDASGSVASCDGSIPPGYLTEGTDCDDSDPSVHPGVVEVCNGIDDDCDGLVDEDTGGEDSDADHVRNLCDNCPLDYNPGQADTNHDGAGDVCDLFDGQIWEWRDDKTSISWRPEHGPTSWNVYIGDLDVLEATNTYTQLPGSNPLAARDCGRISTSASDLAVPSTRRVSFSLVSGVTGGVEGTLGESSGGPRPNAHPCP